MLGSPKESLKKFGSELQSHNHLHFHRRSGSNHHQDKTAITGQPTSPTSSPQTTSLSQSASLRPMTAVNLAQQYEQDKQRLIKYCFTRYEPDGTLHESYITHVRIIEDSHYPSSRPPPNSSPKNKKTRILSLAVKRSGTVRLHKGRENPNGSFQIGRTWNLDELQEVQVDKDSDCGMLMLLGKPYYWATNTAKERTVFIKSICNIFNKFTKGGLPVLVDFDQKLFGDIIALGNKGNPATLRYTSKSSSTNDTSFASTAPSHNSMASNYAARTSLANSNYSTSNTTSNNKDSVISNTSFGSKSRNTSPQRVTQRPLQQQSPLPHQHQHKANSYAAFSTEHNLISPVSTNPGANNSNIISSLGNKSNPLISPVNNVSLRSRTDSGQPDTSGRDHSYSVLSGAPKAGNGSTHLQGQNKFAPGTPSAPYGHAQSINGSSIGSNSSNVMPQLQPKKSFGSLQQKMKMFENGSPAPLPLQPQSLSQQATRKPSLSKLNTQTTNINSNQGSLSASGPRTPLEQKNFLANPKLKHFQPQQLNVAQGQEQPGPPVAPGSSSLETLESPNKVTPPPLAFKSPSMRRLDSPKSKNENAPALSFKSSSPKLYGQNEVGRDNSVIKNNSGSDISTINNNINSGSNNSSRAALKNDILGGGERPSVDRGNSAEPVGIVDRGVLKNELNSFDNNGIDSTMDQSMNMLSPGKMFDSPTHSVFSDNLTTNNSGNYNNSNGTVKSNRSSIIDVEFKSASQRDSLSRRDTEPELLHNEDNELNSISAAYSNNNNSNTDDAAAVMNEIYKQRSISKKPSIKFNKSSNSILQDVAAANNSVPKIPAVPKPVITMNDDHDEFVDDSMARDINDDDYDNDGDFGANGGQEDKTLEQGFAGDIESKGVFDDNIIEETAAVEGKNRQSMGAKKNDTTPLEELFEEIGWNSRDDSKKISQKLVRTLLKTEYESVNSLINISSNFGEIDKYIEESIQQCEKLDPMLTFFQVELDGFNEEISYIESQSSGLQVTTANKKNLWNDLKDIISNVSLSNEELKVLSTYKISRSIQDITIIENVLANLYSALKTIRGVDNGKNSNNESALTLINSDLGNMRALTERNRVYESYSQNFLTGVEDALVSEFKNLYREIDAVTRQALDKITSGNGTSANPLNVDSLIASLNKRFSHLLVYGAFTLYAKEIAKERFYSIMKAYQYYMRKAFHEVIANVIAVGKNILRLLFGSFRNSSTNFHYRYCFDYRVNRANLLLDETKQLSGNNVFNLFDSGLSGLVFHQVHGIIQLLQNLIIQQQNFISEFFHLSSLDEITLDEYLKTFSNPSDRVMQFLKKKQDEEFISKQAHSEDSEDNEFLSLIENIFGDEIISTFKVLAEFATSHTQLLPVIILVIDSNIQTLAKQNNDYIISSFLKKISNRFKNTWYNFNQSQGKIFANNLNSTLLIDKKTDVLFVIKSYPRIVKFVERTLQHSGLSRQEIENNSIRLILDTTYDDYNKFILNSFESTLASIIPNNNLSTMKNRKIRNSTSAKSRGSHATNEEARINKCVNLIANSNYLIDSFEKSDLITMIQFRTTLYNKIYKDCLRIYIETLIQHSLGKLIDFVEGIEAFIKNSSRNVSVDPTKNNTYSKENFRALMSYYNKNEVNQHIKSNFRKIDGDFAEYNSRNSGNEAEELLLLQISEKSLANIKNKLVHKIWKQVENEYVLLYKRLEGISARYYREVEFEVNRNSLVQMFNNVAESAGI